MALSGGLRALVVSVSAVGIAGSAVLGGFVGYTAGAAVVGVRTLLQEPGSLTGDGGLDGLPDTGGQGDLGDGGLGDGGLGDGGLGGDGRAAAGAYAEPRPDRPVVELAYEVAAGLSSLAGTESVVLTPDRRVCELVFRLWPNTPETAASGTVLDVVSASVDGSKVDVGVERAGGGAGTPGTLLELPLQGCSEAGDPVAAELAFTVELGEDAEERVGYAPQDEMAWFATAFPLLAWEHGEGWMREPAVPLFGESAGSEAFDLRTLEVSAPSEYVVTGTGQKAGTVQDGDTTTHTFRAPAVRDVAVTVGDLEVVEASVDAGGDEPVRVHVAVPAGRDTAVGPRRWLDVQRRSLGAVAGYLGPYPYSDLWVSVVPAFPTGVEFPGAVFYGDVDPAAVTALVPHETAHMWFYALVGNDQGRDPWLDEGLASFVEALATGTGELLPLLPVPADAHGHLGEPMTWWSEREDAEQLYGAGVYQQGAAALLDARRAAGAESFDAALRTYVRDQAHRVARPEDLRAALAELPEAVAVLEDAGAFRPSGDVT